MDVSMKRVEVVLILKKQQRTVNRMADLAKVRSDYSPDTCLMIAMSEDGDIAIKIIGTGEMRIATSGGRFHGNDLCRVVEAFRNVIEVINDVTGQKQ